MTRDVYDNEMKHGDRATREAEEVDWSEYPYLYFFSNIGLLTTWCGLLLTVLASLLGRSNSVPPSILTAAVGMAILICTHLQTKIIRWKHGQPFAWGEPEGFDE